MLYSRRRLLGTVGVGTLASQVALPPGVAVAKSILHTPDITPRRLAMIAPPMADRVGDILEVQRTIPARGLAQVDPFLMLDHFTCRLRPGSLGGLAPHPHRGIETVTVIFEGALEHGDSLGTREVLEPGDIQWMTAGSGIVHEENPADSFRKSGGLLHGVQLWVNLPKRSKMTKPRYQDRKRESIKTIKSDGCLVRVLAGTAHDLTSPTFTESPLCLIDYLLEPGAQVVLDYPQNWTAFLHVAHGAITVGTQLVHENYMGVLENRGNGIVFQNDQTVPARVLLGGGLPIAEPIARRGPFAMNTQDELEQAWEDYRTGKMGSVANPTYDRVRAR